MARPPETWTLSIEGTSARSIRLRATKDGVPAGDKTFAPRYVPRYLGGPECGPYCFTAHETFP